MAETLLFETKPREKFGSMEARRLRRAGLVPAIVYGHKEETVSVTLPRVEVEKAIRHGVRVVDLKTRGKTEKALIKEVQWDHLGMHLLHIDFTRVGADERVVVTVPIELRGIAPGTTHGGVLDQPIHSLAVECLAISLPDSIRVNISELQVGGVIHVKDLVLPEGVKAMADPDAIVVHITTPAAAAEPAVGAEVPSAAEPEVIGRQKAAEEGEGD
jgi:large subunit ribosomal protein L25